MKMEQRDEERENKQTYIAYAKTKTRACTLQQKKNTHRPNRRRTIELVKLYRWLPGESHATDVDVGDGNDDDDVDERKHFSDFEYHTRSGTLSTESSMINDSCM